MDADKSEFCLAKEFALTLEKMHLLCERAIPDFDTKAGLELSSARTDGIVTLSLIAETLPIRSFEGAILRAALAAQHAEAILSEVPDDTYSNEQKKLYAFFSDIIAFLRGHAQHDLNIIADYFVNDKLSEASRSPRNAPAPHARQVA
jgi:hypothetical protein